MGRLREGERLVMGPVVSMVLDPGRLVIWLGEKRLVVFRR